MWKGKGVTGLSISISAEGLRFYDETENGYDETYKEFKSVCDSNGYVGELKEQMWQSVVKRVKITNRKA